MEGRGSSSRAGTPYLLLTPRSSQRDLEGLQGDYREENLEATATPLQVPSLDGQSKSACHLALCWPPGGTASPLQEVMQQVCRGHQSGNTMQAEFLQNKPTVPPLSVVPRLRNPPSELPGRGRVGSEPPQHHFLPDLQLAAAPGAKSQMLSLVGPWMTAPWRIFS